MAHRLDRLRLDRRRVLRLGAAGSAAALLAACGKKDKAPGGLKSEEGSLAWAVSGPWRSQLDRERDRFRHPIETLDFFEIKPKDTVLDMWPGAGYMTDILAPWLASGKGHYVAGLIETDAAAPEAATLTEQYKARFSADKKLYGEMAYTAFGPNSGPLADTESVDAVLFLLVLHDWMAAGIAEKAFMDAMAVLKPGGILGIEQHRSDIGNAQDPAATNGYVQEPFVKQLASEAGFEFVEASEINANPKDNKSHPFGVWTLPPQRLTAPRGEPANPEFDGTLYESIGESDRMTLKFKKPG
ncbi:class I SAM-dependent methyltransferase [Asticcacaulis sp. YBE204]|uniref:class I SAM-dependent methyltransferase n=1 Tax=Asticcacaulis sp. YBE204 TaxID=1282363 RepID=UPI0003C3DF08|nr:methyltransferase [Asticcacaulis sp. YBE204]